MSLSSSLNSAVAGLDLASRRADVVARNVANADRPGYARRTLEASASNVAGSGAQNAVVRGGDPRLAQFRREAESREANSKTFQTFHAALDTAIGDPDQAGSLQDSIALFDSALISAAADPNSASRLAQVSLEARGIADKLNFLDGAVQDLRQKADTDIGNAVTQLNADLSGVERLNRDILRLRSGGHDAANLLDQRSVLVDRIGSTIPIRELPRDHGGIALVTTGGVMLLDGRAMEVGFSPRAPIIPSMTASVQLSCLTINGRDVNTTDASGGIRGGSLAAMFSIRDEVAPRATARFDAMAAELIGRFADPAVDPTTASGSAGLFTDDGGPFNPMAPKGLAGRIALNAFVTPDRQDQHFRLRDGLGATTPATGGSPALLLRYGSALALRAPPTASGLPDAPADLQGHAAALRSLVSMDRVRADDRYAVEQTQAEGLAEARDGGGVDLDGEMRHLLEVEQAYAANARVIQAVSDMMNRLTEI